MSNLINVIDLVGGTLAGIVVLLFITGWVWAKPAVDALIRSIDKKDEDLTALRQSIDDRVLPVIEQNTELANRVASLLEQRDRTDRQILDALERNNRTAD